MGSESTHGERIGLAVQRLNQSCILSVQPSNYELSFLFRFWFQSILISIHPYKHTFDQRLTTADFFPILIVRLETDEEIFDRKLGK